MRALVNRYADWVFNDDYDAWGGVGRFSSLFGMTLVALGVVTAGAIFVVGLLVGHQPPSLFCPNGSTLHPSPATHIIGKVPVDGVEYTCS